MVRYDGSQVAAGDRGDGAEAATSKIEEQVRLLLEMLQKQQTLAATPSHEAADGIEGRLILTLPSANLVFVPLSSHFT